MPSDRGGDVECRLVLRHRLVSTATTRTNAAKLRAISEFDPSDQITKFIGQVFTIASSSFSKICGFTNATDKRPRIDDMTPGNAVETFRLAKLPPTTGAVLARWLPRNRTSWVSGRCEWREPPCTTNCRRRVRGSCPRFARTVSIGQWFGNASRESLAESNSDRATRSTRSGAALTTPTWSKQPTVGDSRGARCFSRQRLGWRVQTNVFPVRIRSASVLDQFDHPAGEGSEIARTGAPLATSLGRKSSRSASAAGVARASDPSQIPWSQIGFNRRRHTEHTVQRRR